MRRPLLLPLVRMSGHNLREQEGDNDLTTASSPPPPLRTASSSSTRRTACTASRARSRRRKSTSSGPYRRREAADPPSECSRGGRGGVAALACYSHELFRRLPRAANSCECGALRAAYPAAWYCHAHAAAAHHRCLKEGFMELPAVLVPLVNQAGGSRFCRPLQASRPQPEVRS